jgi:hypothetical protein
MIYDTSLFPNTTLTIVNTMTSNSFLHMHNLFSLKHYIHHLPSGCHHLHIHYQWFQAIPIHWSYRSFPLNFFVNIIARIQFVHIYNCCFGCGIACSNVVSTTTPNNYFHDYDILQLCRKSSHKIM